MLVLAMLVLSLPLSAAQQVTRPASNWGGGGCSQWVPLLLHNALCKHDSPLPNSGPCCEPKEADRTLAGACSTPNHTSSRIDCTVWGVFRQARRCPISSAA